MKLGRVLALSLRTLLAHRLRSLLAATGVGVGIAAVVMVTALGRGAAAELEANLGDAGTQLLVVRPAQIKRSAAHREMTGMVTSLAYADAEAVTALPNIETVAPVVEGPVRVVTARGSVRTTALGTTSAFFAIRSFAVAEGRAFAGGDDDDDELARVVVLGARIGAAMFPAHDALEQEVRINGVGFTAIGVLAAKGVAADGADADNQVFVPVRTALRRVFNSRSLSALFVRVGDPETLDTAETAIAMLLRERHLLDRRDQPNDFTVQNQRRLLSARQETMRWFMLLTSGLAAVSLAIGGSGILALMLLSVRERTPEIGLRMAVGARPRDVLVQFLAEAMLLAVAGGVLGVGLGMLGAWGAARLAGWPVAVTIESALAYLGAAAAVGVVFGALPAANAALLPPVRALGLE